MSIIPEDANSIVFRSPTAGDFEAIVAVMDQWWQRPIQSILPRLFLDHFCDTSLIAENSVGVVGFLIGFPSLGRSQES